MGLLFIRYEILTDYCPARQAGVTISQSVQEEMFGDCMPFYYSRQNMTVKGRWAFTWRPIGILLSLHTCPSHFYQFIKEAGILTQMAKQSLKLGVKLLQELGVLALVGLGTATISGHISLVEHPHPSDACTPACSTSTLVARLACELADSGQAFKL